MPVGSVYVICFLFYRVQFRWVLFLSDGPEESSFFVNKISAFVFERVLSELHKPSASDAGAFLAVPKQFELLEAELSS